MIEKLTALWKRCETKELAKIFEAYMKNIGVKKYSEKNSDAINTYLADGKSTGWNRVSCYYKKDNANYGEEDLAITLRKRSGDYLIIERKLERAFEVDYSGIRHYDEKLLNEIISDHKPLFDELIKIGA